DRRCSDQKPDVEEARTSQQDFKLLSKQDQSQNSRRNTEKGGAEKADKPDPARADHKVHGRKGRHRGQAKQQHREESTASNVTTDLVQPRSGELLNTGAAKMLTNRIEEQGACHRSHEGVDEPPECTKQHARRKVQ